MRATSSLGESIVPNGRKARAVLGYLCLNAGQRIPRSRLASLLWDRVPDQQARTNLRQALRELSTAMGPELTNELIASDVETVRLEPRSCWIDALAVLSSGLAQNSFRADLDVLTTGELLEDLSGVTAAYDQWLLAERTRFSSELTLLLERELQQLCESQADPDRRAALARRVIGFDATHEGASRILMRALVDMGERAQALKEYDRCRAALRAALDVEPSSETRALHQALKTFSGIPAKDSGPASSSRMTSVNEAAPVGPAGRLRVGVLPFHCAPSQRAKSLANPLSQQLAAALARFRWFDVFTPLSLEGGNSAGGVANMLRRNQWHYVVEGSVAGSEDKLRVGIRLVDLAQEARPVWSGDFDLTPDALDEVEERVVGPAVARIDPVLIFIEGQQRKGQRAGATGLVLRAIPLMYSLQKDKYEEAGRLIGEAIRSEPENAKAVAWGAFWHVWYTGQGWASDPAHALVKAQDLALRAIRIDPESAEALGVYAHICAFLDKDFDSAVHYFERALGLNPNLAFTWVMSAPTFCYVGQADRALQHLDRYRALAPFDPHFQFWEGTYTVVYAFKGDYESAARVGRRAVKVNPEFSAEYKPLIASLGHLGRREEAAPYIAKLLSIEPTFTVEGFGRSYPFQRAEDRERYLEGLRLAGVPTGSTA